MSPDSTFGGAYGENMVFMDVNHDGFQDLIASDAQKPVNGVPAAGKAFVRFGPTLSSWVAMAPAAPAWSEKLGWQSMSVGDANGDGEYDILLGSPGYDAGGPVTNDYGRVHLFLGPTFQTDFVLNDPTPEVGGQFGWAVLLTDIEGDGLDDAVVGAPYKSRVMNETVLSKAGQVWLWHGSDLEGLPTAIVQPKPREEGHFGFYLVGVTGAGAPETHDLIVSALDYPSPLPPTGTGLLYRYDAAFGQPSIVLPFSSALFQYAQFSQQVDFDGDGLDDILVTHFDGVNEAGILHAPDFQTSLHSFHIPPGPTVAYGWEGAISDLDRDGSLDVLLSESDYTLNGGAVHVIWGPDLVREDLIGPGWFGGPVQSFGHALATGDIDGDGFDEIAVQTPGSFSGGIVYLLRRRTLQADTSQISIGAGTSVNLTLDLSASQAGNTYLAALSLAAPGEGLILGRGVYLPLQVDSMTSIGLSLLGTNIVQGFVGVLDGQGHASMTLNWPAHKGGGLSGQTLHVAAITASPSGQLGVGSNSVALSLQP